MTVPMTIQVFGHPFQPLPNVIGKQDICTDVLFDGGGDDIDQNEDFPDRS